MTDRGPQIVNPARACPFVAFVDERDERATVPDHRHRCYAEEVPAPRALAHQEAYCLSSNFPVCPTFQDWAKREAAQARDVPGGALLAGGAGAAAGAGGLFSETRADADVDDLGGRERRRDWAAPPAWGSDVDDDVVGESPLVPPVTTPGGSAAALPPLSPAASPPAGLGSASIPGGLSGSLADRMAGGRDDEVATPGNRRDWEDANRAWGEATRAKIDDVDDEFGDDTGQIDRAALVGGAAAGGAVVGRRDATGWPREDREPAGRTIGDREAAVAPSWERPKRFEAYPALGSRRGLPVVPLVIGLIVIALAAILLFKLPEFLGVGAPASTASPSPSVVLSSEQPPPTTPTSSAEASPEATGASQTTYKVQPGDTMTKIANKFSVPLQDLIDANKDTVPNPSNLVVGQTLIIPTVAPTTLPDAGTQAP